MKPILVFTDPHLGKTLASHTTLDSRRRLRNDLYHQALGVLEMFPEATSVCLGDLFDRYTNPEDVIWQGMHLAQRLDYLMAGNHDLINDRDRMGTLQLMHRAGYDSIQLTLFGEVRSYLHQVAEGVYFVFVPHHSTDDLFQQALAEAGEWVRHSKPEGSRAYLCVHCNYDSGFATDDTALSLSRKQAKELLADGFDYILVGHDHHPREDWDGRVIILGNTHPTGFGDITDKRVLLIHPDGTHEFYPVWLKKAGYVEVAASELIDPAYDLERLESVNFIEITGDLDASQVMDMARAVRRIWLGCAPLAVRNKVEVRKPGSTETLANHDFYQLDMMIRAELIKRPELVDLFDVFWSETAPALQEEEA